MKTIYLDNNATTMTAPEVVEAMMPFFGEYFGNPSSIHKFGGSVRKYVDRAREEVASLLKAKPDEIFFTSCGSESDNQALKGFLKKHKSKTRIITSAVEHPAVLNTCRLLREEGVSVKEISVDENGMLNMDEFYHAQIDEDTLVSIMWANNETGVLFPIRELSEYVKSKGGTFHTDAVQAVGKLSIDMSAIPVDILALSGHKLHAPKGVGAIYIREGTAVAPLITGGHQEDGMRAGTENVPYIAGLGKACELAAGTLQEETVQESKLRDKLEKALLEQCPGAKLNGHPEKRLPNTTNISFEFIEGEAILLMLDEHGIAASSGSACTTGSLEPSHVMRAMGIPYTFAHSSTRFSLSRYTTEEEIDKVIEVMPGIVKRLRELSPFVK
ncbi:MAG: cysteine desulfurase NifS [Chitinivibrionales bacterium]|nr:cysteine desulfurase NifS [Chitinivibrionales bacterium]